MADGKTIPAEYVFKPGDRVELVVEVVCCEISDGWTCEVKSDSGHRAVFAAEELRIGRLLPRGLKAGDSVRYKNGYLRVGVITEVDGEWVWFRYPDDSRGTARMTDLVLAP